jgi:hypothetical protein
MLITFPNPSASISFFGETAGLDFPNYWVAFPWPESDRLGGRFRMTTSLAMTIAKVRFWVTGSACFNPPVEEG